VKIKYFLLRGKFYKNRGNSTLTHKFLKAGLDAADSNFENEEVLKDLIDIILELSEFYIHYKSDERKAYNLLKNIEKHIRLKKISNMKRAMRWNLLMSDYYITFPVERKKSQFYLKQSHKIKKQLQTIGVVT
jgi:hypothetical protein